MHDQTNKELELKEKHVDKMEPKANGNHILLLSFEKLL